MRPGPPPEVSLFRTFGYFPFKTEIFTSRRFYKSRKKCIFLESVENPVSMIKTRMPKPPLATAFLGLLGVVSGDRYSGCLLASMYSQGSTIILQHWIHLSPQCQMVFKHTQTGEAIASNNWMLAAVQDKPGPFPSSGASPNFCFNGQARDCLSLSQILGQLLKMP